MKLKKSHKWTIGIVVVLIIALIVWWLLSSREPRVSPTTLAPTPAPPKDTTPTAPTNPKDDTSSLADDAVMLRLGSRGETVKVLQRYLNLTIQAQSKEYKVELLSVDGIFGAKTEGYLDICHQTTVITYGQYRTIQKKM